MTARLRAGLARLHQRLRHHLSGDVGQGLWQGAAVGLGVSLMAGVVASAVMHPPHTDPGASLSAAAAAVHEVAAGPSTAAPSAQPVAPQAMDPLAGLLPPGGASPIARQLARWVVSHSDHGGLPFFIVDKPGAVLHVFDAGARHQGSSPVLLGAALGDSSVPGIGERPLALVTLAERTTPAGRFLAERGVNLDGEEVLWVDYEHAVSMHRVRANVASERRQARLASATTTDNRISYGCINVPVAFFEAHVAPAAQRQRVVVYVLPDQLPLKAVFTRWDDADEADQPDPTETAAPLAHMAPAARTAGRPFTSAPRSGKALGS